MPESLHEKRQRIHGGTFAVAVWSIGILSCIIMAVVGSILNWSPSSYPPFIIPFLIGFGALFAGFAARRASRRAGVSADAAMTEVLLAPTPDVSLLSMQTPYNRKSEVGGSLILLLLIVPVEIWGLGMHGRNFFEITLGWGSGVSLFSIGFICLWNAIRDRTPFTTRLDNTGITRRAILWQRKQFIPWTDISACEIFTSHNVYGELVRVRCVFTNRREKKLITLTFAGQNQKEKETALNYLRMRFAERIISKIERQEPVENEAVFASVPPAVVKSPDVPDAEVQRVRGR